MQQLPVDWEIPFPSSTNSFGGFPLLNSKLILNKEWEIECFHSGNGFKETSVAISRKTVSEGLLVSGSLSFSITGQQEITQQEFAKLMTIFSSSIKIQLNTQLITKIRGFQFGPQTLNSSLKLSGMIYITPTSKKAYASSSNECKNWQSLEELSKYFERLLDPKTSSFADFNLKCHDVLIPFHRDILSARSAVFAAMLAHEMKENSENQVDITDLDEFVLRSMLNFMYTGMVPLTVDLASDLLCAANKYQIHDLERVCCDFLKKNLSNENMLMIYALGDLHNRDLKSFVEDYICKKCFDFLVFEATKEWKTFRKENPDLALDIMVALVKARDLELNGNSSSKVV